MLSGLRQIAEWMDTILEFLGWRDEWNTKANPVAFWLAVCVALVLAAGGLFYAADTWRYFQGR